MSHSYPFRSVRGLMLAGMLLDLSALTPCHAQSLSNASAVITYADGAPRRIYAFPTAFGDFHPPTNYWDGSRWSWADLGSPGFYSGGANVITYKDGTQPQRIYVFGSSVDSGFNLHVNFWDGSQWRWANQGGPLVSAEAPPSAITYTDDTGARRIYVFVTSFDFRLYVNYWDGLRWRWADLGRPSGPWEGQEFFVETVSGAITYKDGTQPQIISVFVRGSSRLYVKYWDGSGWHWADQGMPPGTAVDNDPAVVTYKEGTQPRRVYAFVRGRDQRLYVNFWDGTRWLWADQGTPPGTTMADSTPAAVTFKDPNQPQRIYAFVAGQNGHLYVNYWDGVRWHWADQGTAPVGSVERLFGAVTFQDTFYDGPEEPRKIYVYVGSHWPLEYSLNYWDGYRWHWQGQGTP